MKVALIFPRRRDQVHGMWPPLGITTLGAVLLQQGHEVRCHDTSFDPDLTRVKAALAAFRPDLVGVSTLTDFFAAAAELIRHAKSLGAITVMGGPHPTIAPRQSLEAIPELDYAVMGEGETTLSELAAQTLDPAAIAGLAFRRGGEIIIAPNRPAEVDLDALPIPDRDLLDVEPLYLKNRAINLHVSRGCPYRCRFCQPTLERMFGKKLKFRSPARVVEELQQLHDRYRVTDFFFHDDTFTANRRWLQELSAGIQAAGLNRFRYVVNSRVDTFSEETARLLRDMGCYYVLFGIESGSQKVLDSLDKGATVEQARQAFALCRRFGFRTHAYVILASPEEDAESLRATEDLIEELKPHTVHISICTPLLGTRLAEDCQTKGMVNLSDFADFDYYLKRNQAGQLPIPLPTLSYEQVLASRSRILKRRKFRVLADNLRELGRDFWRDPDLGKFIFRYAFYRKMQHYFG